MDNMTNGMQSLVYICRIARQYWKYAPDVL